MPKPLPLARTTREAVAHAIRAGEGRNAIARTFGISPGSVTNIARERGLWFERCTQTATASRARQIDQWAERVDRVDHLMRKILALPTTMRHDGTATRAIRRLDSQLRDANRHHNGRHHT
ncbi:hypothetical protein [Agromyces bauzanensis]